MNFAGKVLVEKEGEIVFDRKYFRLKGKGANDHGEIINFTDIKESKAENDKFVFLTFAREKFELSRFGDSVENFLVDFYKIKNEFFAENLFMREGMLMGQFDCSVDVSNSFGKSIHKGLSTMIVFEESVLILPRMSDAFSINYNFIKHHQFIEDDYLFEIETDSGSKINISKLGSHFEEAQDLLEGSMEKIYQKLLNQLNLLLPGYSPQVLLKLAYAIKSGKAVDITSLKKIDASLPQKTMDVCFENHENLKKRVEYLRTLDKESKFYLGFSMQNDGDYGDIKVKAWFICALPTLNTIIIGMANDSKDPKMYFFRIVMEQGLATDRLEGKVLEINQCMVLFNYDLDPILKDKNDLRKTKYRVAILRLSFLRLFRRSFLGFSGATGDEEFKSDANRYFAMAKVLKKPVLRHNQLFKRTLK